MTIIPARVYRPTQEETLRARRIAQGLAAWATSNLREFPWRTYRTEYEILVAETLLQRTRAAVVAAFIGDFLREFPTWKSLAEIDRSELADRLAPLGLQERRATSLQRLAESRQRGSAESPGVGQYIGRAAAVMLRNASEAMVDSNFVRLLHRAFQPPWMSDYRYDARLQALALVVVQGAESARTINLAVLDFGALVCKPRRPNCLECPLIDACIFGSTAQGKRLSLEDRNAFRPGNVDG